MYDQRNFGGHCRSGGVYYPRFGGDLGVERHWEVDDVKRLLFGTIYGEPSETENISKPTGRESCVLRLIPASPPEHGPSF